MTPTKSKHLIFRCLALIYIWLMRILVVTTAIAIISWAQWYAWTEARSLCQAAIVCLLLAVVIGALAYLYQAAKHYTDRSHYKLMVTFHKPAGITSYRTPNGDKVECSMEPGLYMMGMDHDTSTTTQDLVRSMIPGALIISVEPWTGLHRHNGVTYPVPMPSKPMRL